MFKAVTRNNRIHYYKLNPQFKTIYRVGEK